MHTKWLWLAGLLAGQSGACLALLLVTAMEGGAGIGPLDTETLAATLLGSAVTSMIGWKVYARLGDLSGIGSA